MNSVASSGTIPSAVTQPWTGSTALDHWDLIVIGNDFCDLEAALLAADFHGRVGVVEQHTSAGPINAAVGGTGPDHAALLAAAHNASRASTPPPWPFAPASASALPANPQAKPVLSLEASHRIQLVRLPGWSLFTGPHTVAVHGREMAFHRAILATGSRHDQSAIAGLDETGFTTPDTLSSITQVPKRVAVLGAGGAACELAQAFRKFGSEVYLVAEQTQLLEGEEPAVAAIIQQALAGAGVRLHLGWRCLAASTTGRAKAVLIARDNEQRKLLVDQIVLAQPGRANLDRLGLEAAGIRVEQRRGASAIQVDSRLMTSNARVFAVGAVCAGNRATEALERMCGVAVQNAVGVARPRFDPLLVPRGVATDPQVAHIGVTADEARQSGLEVDSWWLPFAPAGEPIEFNAAPLEDASPIDPACREFAIVHTARELVGRVAGATVVGPHGGEALAAIALLMAEELPLSVLSRSTTLKATYAHSLARLGEVVERVAHSATGRFGRARR